MLHNLKMLLRSRSWDFMRSRKQGLENYDRKLYSYYWNNHQVYYRPGTSDRGLVYNILIQKGKKAEYYISDKVKPDIILDIGSNIGITAIWMARKFPTARIFCFEPMQDNFHILEKNIEPYKNITACNFGLGAESGVVDIYANEDITNQGGFSLYKLASDGENIGTEQKAHMQIEVKNIADILHELNINNIDIIKIDTEGAEYEILTSIPEELLSRNQWVMGELHGVKNFETLAFLDKWFSIELNKKITSNLFQFFSINKSFLKSLAEK